MYKIILSIISLIKILIPKFGENVHRWHQLSEKDSTRYLLNQAKEYGLKNQGKVLVLGLDGESTDTFIRSIKTSNIKYLISTYEKFTTNKLDDIRVAAIISLYGSEDINYKIAKYISNHKKYSSTPFEYTFISKNNYQVFNQHDQNYYSSSYFVSPLLLDGGLAYEIYKESLIHFEKKCDIRDYLDLYQVIKNIIDSGIKGDIVEFGSYKGHSSYLILKTLEKFKSSKKLYMYDTFKAFPKEKLGLDKFWSSTHEVNYSDIKEKFSKHKNAVIVKGDFTSTFDMIHPKSISLAYIDCDSYRSTKYIIDNVIRNYLQKNSYIIFEDYGHPALLGNRVAVNNFIENNPDLIKFFSQFSGLYIFVKK